MTLNKAKQSAFDAFRAAVHVEYIAGSLLRGGAERICSRAYNRATYHGSDELLTTPTADLLAGYMEEDVAWRAAHPPRNSVLVCV